MTKEERAIEYAKARYGNNGKETQNEIAKVIACRVGYEAGWDEALKSQWIIQTARLPKLYEKVLVLFEYGGEIQIHDYTYMGGDFVYGDCRILAWMPIPPFDKILKDNKEVLND